MANVEIMNFCAVVHFLKHSIDLIDNPLFGMAARAEYALNAS